MPPPARAVAEATVEGAVRIWRALAFDQSMAAVLLGTMALLPLLSPMLGGSYVLHIGERALILAIAAISLELLIGVGGMVSFGHAAFLGIGAYAAGIAASHGYGTVTIALPAALAASALFALLTGAIAVRTRGVYFIMITLAFGQMAFFVASSLAPYGGDDGFGWPGRTLVAGTRILKTETVFFYLTLAGAAAAYVLASRLIGSRFGRVLRGMTNNETRLQAIGFAPYPFRLTAYVIAGTMCGFAGFLLGNHAEFVSPAYMHWQRSGELIVMVLLGGTGTVYGPLLGALAFVLLEEVLSGLTEHWKAILGPILVLVVLFARGGLAGGIEHALARWRRRRLGPRELLGATAALAGQHARVGLTVAAAWSAQQGNVLRRQLGTMRVIMARDAAGIVARCRVLASEIGARLAALARHGKRYVARVRARWHPWKRALARQPGSLVLRAERGLAAAAERWRRR